MREIADTDDLRGMLPDEILAALSAERARADELQDAAHWLTDERERLQLELQDATQERDQLRARADVAEQARDASINARLEWQREWDRDRPRLVDRAMAAERERDQLRAQRDDAVGTLRELRRACMVPAGTACRLCYGCWVAADGERPSDHHAGCPLREIVSVDAAILQAADQRGGGEVGE